MLMQKRFAQDNDAHYGENGKTELERSRNARCSLSDLGCLKHPASALLETKLLYLCTFISVIVF